MILSFHFFYSCSTCLEALCWGILDFLSWFCIIFSFILLFPIYFFFYFVGILCLTTLLSNFKKLILDRHIEFLRALFLCFLIVPSQKIMGGGGCGRDFFCLHDLTSLQIVSLFVLVTIFYVSSFPLNWKLRSPAWNLLPLRDTLFEAQIPQQSL